MATNSYKNREETESFWTSLPSKLKVLLYNESRALVLSSDDVPVYPQAPSRIRASPRYLLFTDIFVILQGTILVEYPLEWVWLDHLPNPDIPSSHLPIPVNNFKLILPETVLELQCKEFAHKSMWVSCMVHTIGLHLNIPQFINSRGDLTLDTQLQLVRGREFMEYTYQTVPDMKDGKYKGPWLNAQPHGTGEYWHEPSGKLYKGGFKKGVFYGRGELLWFTDTEDKKKYIGEFVKGQMDGRGEMKFSNGDVYDGCWNQGRRCGYGTLEVASRKNSKYTGGWRDDKRSGYGVYDDRMRHERYLGMWVEGERFGPGIIVTSNGTYCEATFTNGMAGSSISEGLILDPNGSSFMGKIGAGFRLAGKGILTLTNGVVIEGVFSGPWHGSLEIQRGVLNCQRGRSPSSTRSRSGSFRTSNSDYQQVARLDRRIGTCTVLASNKWQPVYEECERLLGFSGNAASDVITAWSRIASVAYDNKQRAGDAPPTDSNKYFQNPVRRASSLSVIPKSVRTPGELITLERARAQTIFSQLREEEEEGVGPVEEGGVAYVKCHSSLDELEQSLLQMSIEHSIRKKEEGREKGEGRRGRVEISGPLHLQDEVVSSYPPNLPSSGGHAHSLGHTPSVPAHWLEDTPIKNDSAEEDSIDYEEAVAKQRKAESRDSKIDTTKAIQKYVDKAFNTPTHPLGVLMNHIEGVFRDSYGGVGANRFLLPHAIAEVHYIIKRLHTIIRILFPFLDNCDQEITRVGLHRISGADPDDYLCIESGYQLLHPLVFMRIFPTLIMLYILHHVEEDRRYQGGVDNLLQMDDARLVHFIRLPVSAPLSSQSKDLLQCLDRAARILKRINTLYTPGEFLELFKMAFRELSSVGNLSGDLLLPAVVYIVVHAKLQHLGAYLHFLTDFAHTNPEEEYILVTYEAAYNFIQKQDSTIL